MTFKNIKTEEDLEREKYNSEVARVRSLRDIKLKELDHFVMNPLRWVEINSKDKELLSHYRRSLLDLTEQDGFPFLFTMPAEPVVMTK